MKRAIVLLIAIVVACTSLPNKTASLQGTVVDRQSGSPLPGVTVTITNKSNGAVQTQVTGSEGNFRAVALQPAPYEIKAHLAMPDRMARTARLT